MPLFVIDNTKEKRTFNMFEADLKFVANAISFKKSDEIQKDKDEFERMCRVAFKEYAKGNEVSFSLLYEKVKEIEKKEINHIRDYSKKLIEKIRSNKIIKKIASKEALIPNRIVSILANGYFNKGHRLFN